MKTILIISALLLLGTSCEAQKTSLGMNYSIDEILERAVDPEDAIMELDSILNEKSNYGEDISVLTEGEKVVLFIENLEQEVNNGGFDQFFFNSSGNYTHETLKALEQIGSIEIKTLLSKAIAVWPNKNVPKIQMTRRERQLQLSESAQEKWNTLDEEFFHSQEYIPQLLVNYIETHKKQFSK